MNLRTLAGRDGALMLAIAWTAFGATALFVTVAAGGAIDGWLLLPFLPALVALASALSRTEDASRRLAAGRLIVWITAALLVSTVAATFGSSVGGGRLLLEPPPDLALAGAVAASLTALGAALGWRRGLRATLGLAGVLVVLIVAAGVATTVALPGHIGTVARCGPPTSADLERARLLAEGSVDGLAIRSLAVDAQMAGARESWSAEVRSGPALGRFENVTLDGTGTGRGTLTGRVVAAIGALAGAATEDLGVELIEGTPARHCRQFVDGPQAIDAFPALGWLLTGALEPAASEVFSAPADPRASLPIWRGELDWWLAADGRLVRAGVRAGGHPADAWGMRGLRGQLVGSLTVAGSAAASTEHAAPVGGATVARWRWR